jgi:hypothetical protein
MRAVSIPDNLGVVRHDIQHNGTQYNDIQHNDTQHNGVVATHSIIDNQHNSIKLSVVMLYVVFDLLLC